MSAASGFPAATATVGSGYRPLTTRLLHLLLFAAMLGSPFVFIEPSPYEVFVGLLAIGALVAGVTVDRKAMPLLFLLLIWNVSGLVALVPVIYDRRVSGGLIGHLAGAINGRAVARGTSFLKDKMGEKIFADGLRILDNPHRKRGLGSRPFDAEGLATKRLAVIDDGRLTTWLLDLAAARQLKLKPTGHATRGTSGPPSPTTSNFYLEKGKLSVEELIADIKSGLFITDLIGFGINGVTGDYSRGASGFWIENGKLAWPVSGITVAGNLKDMFLNMTPANDLQFKGATNAPTVRIEGMTVAGS